MRLIVAALCAAMAAPAGAATLERIKETGTFTIGYREGTPPFSSAAGGEPVGYSIDICRKVADAVKEQLKLPALKLRFVPVTAEDRFTKVESGAIDIECGSTTRTISRGAAVDFSLLIFATGAELLVRTGSGLDDAPSFTGKRVAVAGGTTTEKVMAGAFQGRGVKVTFVPVKDHEAGIRALEDGAADAYASDETVLIGLARRSKLRDSLRLSGHLYSYEPYALMLRRNDADFRLVVDRTIARLYRSQEITGIYTKWFGDWGLRPSDGLVAMYLIESIPE